MTLEEKVRSVLFDEGSDRPHRGLDWNMSDFECGLESRGIVYGLALGIARPDDPCESMQSVAARAAEALDVVFEEFNSGPLVSPDRDELFDQLEREWEAACGEAVKAARSDVVVTRGLTRAINRMVRAGSRVAEGVE